MINFDTENISKTKDILKKINLKEIKKDIFFKRNENGWGIFLLKHEIYAENLTNVVIFSLPPNTYIAHRHISDIDYEYCHYVLNTNEECGIIIDNEFIKYCNGLLFSFNYGMMPHIVWNNGSTTRDSLVFIYKKTETTMSEWIEEKKRVVNNEYVDFVLLDKEQILNMTKKFNIKIKNL